MKKFVSALFACVFLASVGCGGKTGVDTKPFTDDQKAAIKAQDKSVEDEESGKNRK